MKYLTFDIFFLILMILYTFFDLFPNRKNRKKYYSLSLISGGFYIPLLLQLIVISDNTFPYFIIFEIILFSTLLIINIIKIRKT